MRLWVQFLVRKEPFSFVVSLTFFPFLQLICFYKSSFETFNVYGKQTIKFWKLTWFSITAGALDLLTSLELLWNHLTFSFSCYSFLLVLGSRQLNAESDWIIATRAFSSPWLCHNAKHFIRKRRSVLLAVSFKGPYFCLKSSAWKVKMGLAWSSSKSKRKDKKAHKR